MNKKVVIIGVIAVLIIGLGIFAGIKILNSSNKNDEEKVPVVTTSNNEQINEEISKIEKIKVEKIDSKKEYVYSGGNYAMTGRINYDDGTVFDYPEDMLSYPVINLNTQEIKTINEDVKKLYDDAIQSKETIDYGFNYTRISYISSILEKYISVVVTTSEIYVPAGGFEDTYYVYNIDKSRGSLISNQDLIKELGLTEEKYNEKIKQELKNSYPEMDTDLSESEFVSTANYKLNETPIYLNQDGTITSLVMVKTFEGEKRHEIKIQV